MHIRDLPKIEGVLKKDGNPQFLVIHYASFKNFIGKVDLEGVIDEAQYLRSSTKIPDEIQSNGFTSPTQHFLKAGYFDKRSVKILR